MTRYTFNFAPGSAEAGCMVCGNIFLSPASFDKHRGIRPQGRRGDETQDGGRCELRGLRQDDYGRWGSTAELERVAHMRQIRGLR